jgi:glucose-1-phosphate adenylyltransferase
MLSGGAIASRTFAFILAGGEGLRLHPLTRNRAKPAVPFGGVYRLIDFTLSNTFNSGLYQIRILTQYQCESLRSYTEAVFQARAENNLEVCLCPAKGRRYAGTADAVFQNLPALPATGADLVLILSGDHVYRMDYRNFIRFHLESAAEATVAAVEWPVNAASQFGVFEVDSKYRVVGFEEKPTEPKAIFSKPSKSLVNMGVYLFNRRTLLAALTEDSQQNTTHDFGRDILPELAKSRRLKVYNFSEMGLHLGAYWRDVGTLESYYRANMEFPLSDFVDPYKRADWPLHGAPTLGMSFRPGEHHSVGLVRDSVVSSGACIGQGARVVHSVLSPGVQIGPRAEIRNSVLLHDARIGVGARIHEAVVDENVDVPDGFQVGCDSRRDRHHGFVTENGVVVLTSTSNNLLIHD